MPYYDISISSVACSRAIWGEKGLPPVGYTYDAELAIRGYGQFIVAEGLSTREEAEAIATKRMEVLKMEIEKVIKKETAGLKKAKP